MKTILMILLIITGTILLTITAIPWSNFPGGTGREGIARTISNIIGGLCFLSAGTLI